jgi:hypothetical protein
MNAPNPIFPIPDVPPFVLAALEASGLTDFYNKNADVFTKLVIVFYAGFPNRIAELLTRDPKPEGEELFQLFCREISLLLTAASSQVVRNIGKVNNLARALLYNHLRRQGVVDHFQDFFADDGKDKSKVAQLIDHFVHYIIAKGFERGAANHASNPDEVVRAMRVIHDVNRGAQRLQDL